MVGVDRSVSQTVKARLALCAGSLDRCESREGGGPERLRASAPGLPNAISASHSQIAAIATPCRGSR